ESSLIASRRARAISSSTRRRSSANRSSRFSGTTMFHFRTYLGGRQCFSVTIVRTALQLYIGGSVKAILIAAFALSCSAGTVVVPGSAEGTGVSDIGEAFLGSTGITTQMFIPAVMLSGIPIGNQITGIAFRLDSTASSSPTVDLNFSTYEVVLS